MIIGELQLVVTVKDERLESKDGYTQLPKYTGALVKLLQWRQQRSVYPTHGMVEVEPWPTTEARNQRFLTGEKIYFIPHIIKKAHVVPATAPPIQYWFVNNYIDWDQFNTLYDKNFKTKGMRTTDKIAGQFK